MAERVAELEQLKVVVKSLETERSSLISKVRPTFVLYNVHMF